MQIAHEMITCITDLSLTRHRGSINAKKYSSYMQNIKKNWNIRKTWCSSNQGPEKALWAQLWRFDQQHAPWSLQCIRSRFLAWCSRNECTALTQSFSWQRWLTSSLPLGNCDRVRPISTMSATRGAPSQLKGPRMNNFLTWGHISDPPPPT